MGFAAALEMGAAGEAEDRHAGRRTALDAVGRILDDQAVGRIDTERLGGEQEQIRRRLAADNLFGSKADLFSFGNTLRLREMEQFTPQRPRTISVALIGSF